VDNHAPDPDRVVTDSTGVYRRGRDALYGNAGADRIAARDGRRDRLHGGAGRDRARVDRGRDRVRSVELVR
jgi:Ca2+-binding RTX toxin-like protein